MSKKSIDAKLDRPKPYPSIRDIPPDAWKRKEWPITAVEIPEEDGKLNLHLPDGKTASTGEKIDDF